MGKIFQVLIRSLERRITELDIGREVLEKKEDVSEAITNGDILKTDRSEKYLIVKSPCVIL